MKNNVMIVPLDSTNSYPNIDATADNVGQSVVTSDGDRAFEAVYYAGSSLAAGQPVVIGYSHTYGKTAVVAATSAFAVRTAVATKAMSAAGYLWVQTEGTCEALIDGTTDVTAGDFLEVIDAGVAFIKDGAARTTVSGAVAVDAQAANSAVKVTVYLLPEQHTLAAS